MENIAIIGSGWFGLHTAMLLQDAYNVTILEKNDSIFDNSSNYNQNRLHLGYHYPRCKQTRELCYNGYNRFIKKYRSILDFIDKNHYCISKDSIIDYETYKQIFNTKEYSHMILENEYLENIDGKIINTQEKIINSDKAKEYFKNNIKCNILLNYEVTKIEQKNNKVLINDQHQFDVLFDCTYNQMNLSSNEYIYEKTISLLYNRINFSKQFDSITIMDGDFISLFPRNIDKDLYTLTHVKYTPFFKSDNAKNIINKEITPEELDTIKKNIVESTKLYYPDFCKDFIYVSYFLSYKCKPITNSSKRTCNIEQFKNIITVNCGKILGIFELEDFIKNKLKLIN